MANRKTPAKAERSSFNAANGNDSRQANQVRSKKGERPGTDDSNPGKKQVAPFEQVYEIVKKIPRGKVLTYGHISKKMNGRLSAAAVGWALNGLSSEKAKLKGYDSKTVPWHRVLNSKGKISTQEESPLEGSDGRSVTMQQFMLEREGVEFERDGSLNLEKYLWRLSEDL
jgi:Predicted methylated DNA-protein cysteine methyltransferase